MKKWFSLFFVAVLLLFPVSCSNSDGASDEGSSWVYDPNVTYPGCNYDTPDQFDEYDNNSGWLYDLERNSEEDKSEDKSTESKESHGIELSYLDSYVSPGEYATITVSATPGKTYSISVIYNSGASTASGLYAKEADSDGTVSWTWKVGTRTTPGSYDIWISGDGQREVFTFEVI